MNGSARCAGPARVPGDVAFSAALGKPACPLVVVVAQDEATCC